MRGAVGSGTQGGEGEGRGGGKAPPSTFEDLEEVRVRDVPQLLRVVREEHLEVGVLLLQPLDGPHSRPPAAWAQGRREGKGSSIWMRRSV